MAIWNFTFHEGCIWDPILGKGRSYHWKERWWFSIRSPLWPLRYLWPSGHNLLSNVCDAQINRGGSLWVNILGCSLWSRPVMLGSTESEHLRLKSWNYFWKCPAYVSTIPQRHGQTDGRTTCHSNRRNRLNKLCRLKQNKCVLSLRLKQSKLRSGCCSANGRAFHRCGPAVEKLRSPNRVASVERRMLEHRRNATNSDTRQQSSARYTGAWYNQRLVDKADDLELYTLPQRQPV